jgi:hypothetical protein
MYKSTVVLISKSNQFVFSLNSFVAKKYSCFDIFFMAIILWQTAYASSVQFVTLEKGTYRYSNML